MWKEKILYGGKKEKLDRKKQIWIDKGWNFQQETFGSTVFLKSLCHHYRFFDSMGGTNILQGAFLGKMLKQDLLSYIEKNGKPKHTYSGMHEIIDIDNIKNFLNEPILAFDIDNCYWRTAFLLGYITEKTYLKGLEKKEYKDFLHVCIGGLLRVKFVEHYNNGQLVKKEIDNTHFDTFSPFYYNIIEKVYRLSIDLYKRLGKDFLMWLTDCVYFNPKKYCEVEKIIGEHGYTCKKFTCDITGMDDKLLYWTDYSEPVDKQEKCIRYINKKA